MAELHELQARIGAALIDADADNGAVALIANADAARRLAIYRNNITGNALGALRAIYPVTRKIVGTEFFDALARRYCEAHPSTRGDLNEIGGELSGFVRTFEPARELSYLPDVVTLEWHAHRAHFAADHPPLDLRAIAGLLNGDVAHLMLTLHPAVALVSSGYPLFRIWETHQDDYSGEIEVDLASGGEHVVVYRPAFRATVAKLSVAEAAFLGSIQHGKPLGTALAAALETGDPFDFAARLSNWVAAHIIVAIDAPAK